MNPRTQDPDNFVRRSVEGRDFADNIWAPAITALPQTIAQNDNEILAVLLFLPIENATEQGLAFHDFEKPVSDLNGGNSFSFAIAGHDWITTGVICNGFEDNSLQAKNGAVTG